MLPAVNGEAVSVVVAEWAEEGTTGLVAVPFDPPLSFPTLLHVGHPRKAWRPSSKLRGARATPKAG